MPELFKHVKIVPEFLGEKCEGRDVWTKKVQFAFWGNFFDRALFQMSHDTKVGFYKYRRKFFIIDVGDDKILIKFQTKESSKKDVSETGNYRIAVEASLELQCMKTIYFYILEILSYFLEFFHLISNITHHRQAYS